MKSRRKRGGAHSASRSHRVKAEEPFSVYTCSWTPCDATFDQLDHIGRHEREAHLGQERKRPWLDSEDIDTTEEVQLPNWTLRALDRVFPPKTMQSRVL